MKYCRHCDTDKPIADFAKNNRSKDGHINMCKQCKSDNENARDHIATENNNLLNAWGVPL